MFKKKCSKCNEKISKGYEFCPFCGNSLKSPTDKEDYGFLGKNDMIEEMFMEKESSFMDKIFDNAFKIAEKMIEKQLKDMPQMQPRKLPSAPMPMSQENNLEIQFFVNGKRVFPPNKEEISENQKPIKIKNSISKEKISKFAEFPKKEPNSKLRRLSGKLVYEIQVPGVKNIDDVLINQLENSIEIKALGKDKVYSKTLNLNLPIINCKLEQETIFLELKA